MEERSRIAQQDLLVYRSEYKYLISASEHDTLRRLLGTVMLADPYMRSPSGYLIRSLYFDSVCDQDYFDKLDSVEERKKIRLRIYDPDAQSVKLEIKNRLQSYNLKETVGISRADAGALIDGEYDVLLPYSSAIAQKARCIMFSQRYLPKVIVEYDREAYVLPAHDIRITFDKNVRAAASDDLFAPTHSFQPLLEPGTMILEVKFNHFLPAFLQDILACCRSQMLSVSKYCLAREIFE